MKKALTIIFLSVAISFAVSSSSHAYYQFSFLDFILPDLVVTEVRVSATTLLSYESPNRAYEVYRIRAHVKNLGGNLGLTKTTRQMPVNMLTHYDPSMPWGSGTYGDQWEEYVETVYMMDVPKAGETKVLEVTVRCRDDGIGGDFRKVPKDFTFTADQFESGLCGTARARGTIEESDECNNWWSWQWQRWVDSLSFRQTLSLGLL